MKLLDTSMKLSENFLDVYMGRQPKWGYNGLGYIVYLRTYARKKEDGTLEQWAETVRRFTEGNFSIEAKRLAELKKWDSQAHRKLTEEMERFFHLAFNLVILPPGRGLWMSGTEYAERVGDAENNCWFVSMRPQAYEGDKAPSVSFASVFTFDMAMKGGGVGIGVQKRHVDKMPKVLREIELEFYCDENHPDYETELMALGVKPLSEMDRNYYPLVVADSREGWGESLRYTIDAHYDIDSVAGEVMPVDITGVRERGTEIKGFGGIASGPAPLVSMLQQVNKIVNARVGGFVTPTEWGDVVQNIGRCVVAGNVRRTALILIGDEDDKQFVESKNYSLPQNAVASQWRWASNNSVDIGVDTDRETLRNLAVNIFYNGEPGYVNLELSKHYGRIIDDYHENIDGEVEGFNPCGEITLPNGSPCNLFELNLPRIHEFIAAGIEGEQLYEEAAYLAARYAYRITFRPYEWEVTRDIVTRHRRLGIGITGITDWALMAFDGKAIIGFTDEGDAIFNDAMTSKLDALYGFAKAANIEHADELGAEPSIKITTVKPSGTVSILMGVSPGQHYHWSEYMIRRVRMAANAPLVPILLDAGYSVEPAIAGQDEQGADVYDYTTVVVSFPVAAPTAGHLEFQTAATVPLREQAALQAMLATYWSDNAVSATLSFVKPKVQAVYLADGSQLHDKFNNPVMMANPVEENAVIEEITDLLDRYKGVIKSTSLLPHMTDTFPQMPYEAIDKEKYDSMVAKIKANIWELTGDSIAAEDDDTTDTSLECVGNSCPLK